MSVFRKLKGTFQTAQQGFVEGLRAVTLLDGHLKSDSIQHIKSKDINLDVGADLLHEYQNVWSNIQNETKQCSRKAEGVDTNLAPMFVAWDKRAEAVAALEEEIKSLPGILATLKELHKLLGDVRQDFSVVETSLAMLENTCEEIDLKKAMDDETRKLNDYRKRKETETERIKVQLALDHAKRMQDIESSKSMKMKERADAFTSAFEEDIDYYKTHGQTESKLVTEFPKVTSLSQIDIVDEDEKDLDTFLGPQTEEEEPETAPEEQYFEDDYTADFSIKVKEDLDAPEETDDRDLKQGASSPLYLSDQNEEDFSNDENENIVQEKGSYPDSYLVNNADIVADTQEETTIDDKRDNEESEDVQKQPTDSSIGADGNSESNSDVPNEKEDKNES